MPAQSSFRVAPSDRLLPPSPPALSPSRPLLPWRLALLLTLLALDLLLVTSCATACGAGSHCAPGDGETRLAQVSEFVSHVWFVIPYRFGETSLDFCLLSLWRVKIFLCIVLLRARPKKKTASSPSLAPLEANGADSSSISTSTTTTAPPRTITARTAGRAGLVVAAVSLLYSFAKPLARMLQSGVQGPGSGSLPADGTTPGEVYFWIITLSTPILAYCEKITCDAVCAAIGPTDPPLDKSKKGAKKRGHGGHGGNGGDGGQGGSQGEAEDPASSIKSEYLERTSPPVKTLRFTFGLMGPDGPLLCFAYSALIVAAAGESVVPLLYGKVIDAIAISKDPDGFVRQISRLIVAAAITGLATGCRGATFTYVGGRFGVRLRQRLFDSLLRQEATFFGAVKTGEVTSRLSADCEKVSDQVTLNVQVFLRSLVQVIFTFGFMVVISWRLAVTCFVVVPAVVISSKVFGNFMRSLSKDAQQALADANSTADEAVGSILTVKAFAAEAEESRRYERGLADFLHTQWRQARVYFWYSSLTFTFLPYCTYCIVLYYGAQLTATPEGCGGGEGSPLCQLDPPGLVSFVFYMQSLLSAFNTLGSIYTGLAQAVGAADKVVRWIERPPQRSESESVGRRPQTCHGDIRLENIRFRYTLRPEQLVLDGLSLHARAGEVIALCGPSGGGKSSCIGLLERFYEPEAGRVLLDGVPVAELDPVWYHKHVALVGQEPVLFARSIKDNVCYGLEGELDQNTAEGRDEVVRAATLANAHEFVHGFELGYETFVGERGAQLSGGQKQRIAIARALVRRPSVLLLDEATSALDAESEAVVQEAIDAMIAQGGMTVVVIAHRLSTIRNANTILVVKGGTIAEGGTHEELLQRGGEYSKLVAKQMKVNGASGSSIAHESRVASSLKLASAGS